MVIHYLYSTKGTNGEGHWLPGRQRATLLSKIYTNNLTLVPMKKITVMMLASVFTGMQTNHITCVLRVIAFSWIILMSLVVNLVSINFYEN